MGPGGRGRVTANRKGTGGKENGTKSWILKNILLAVERKSHVSKAWNERGDITTDFTAMKKIIRIIRLYLCASRLDSRDEMEEFLKRHSYLN